MQNTRTSLKRLAAISALTAALSTPAFAETYPSISGEVVLELQNEYTAQADNAARDDYNNAFFRTEIAPTLQLNKNLYVDGVLVFENIQDIEPNRSNFFDNEGAFIEELKLNYQKDNIGLFAGKFNPAFGIAWDFGRGIWAEDFAEDYEITERIGFGADYTFGNDKIGTHSLIASTFFADTSFLSRAVITGRGNLDKRDGGTANTEDFSSFAVALEGENLAGIPNLYYKLGYRHQAEGDASTGGDDETGYVATLGHTFPITERMSMDALIEYTDISNFDTGTADNQYFTASAITTIDDAWNLTLGYTSRNITQPNSADIDDHLVQISGGYDFKQGTTAEIGWRGSKESGADTDIIGALIRHTIAF